MQPYTFLMLFMMYFLNLQPRTDEVTTTEPASTSDSESPCSNEAPEDDSQVQPEDNNLTSLNGGVEINLTNEPGSSQQCNTFEPQDEATAGESSSTQSLLTSLQD